MSNRSANAIAICFLLWVFFAGVFSIKDDSLTMDELAHLPAGYSYLTQKDMRLNPEHPPLVKDLAAFPLLFVKGISFPSEIKAWKDDVNGQWDFGNSFLFKSGNPADTMIFWGRIPMILLLILLGFYIFKVSKEFFGDKAAVISLFLFSFSPTLLAHGRLVTTDVGAAFGALFATYYFLKALKNPDRKNIILSGIAFGVAELLKFSLILLMPLFVFLALIYWLLRRKESATLFRTLKLIFFVFLVGFLLIGAVYQYHVWNYPADRQVRDTEFILSSFSNRPLANLIVWLADKPILRAYAQYGLGVAMVLQRAAGGNTTYFMGEVSASGWKNYFPIVYLIKEPLSFHILTLIAFLCAVWLLIRRLGRRLNLRGRLQESGSWLKSHFPEFAMLSFVGLYWLISLKSNLNIGVRHLLPVFPLTFILVGSGITNLLKGSWLKLKYGILAGLIIWQIISVFSVYPHFLAYFNEAAGGPDKGYLWAVDSNLDWGQDLKRLKKWADKKNIDNIYINYFGGGDAQYYLKEKFLAWEGGKNPAEFPKNNYLAVSATLLQGGRARAAKGFDGSSDYYRWLDKYEPVEKIGRSIFVYYID